MQDRVRELYARCVSWFRGRRMDREFTEELSAHLDLAVADAISRGKSPAEARRIALARIGGLDNAHELHRHARGLPALDALGRDVRDAVRLLRRSPAFTAVAVASLALGIGGNTAIFSILNGLVLRPLPVADPAALVQLTSGPRRATWTNPLWEEIRAREDLFAGTAAWSATSQANFGVIDQGELRLLSTYSVSGNFFEVLGVRPARGRLLIPSDDVRGGPPGGVVAVMSDAFWQSHFDRSDDAIGKVLTLNRFAVTIVGVTPPGFFGPEVGRSFDLILPLRALPPPLLDARGFWWVSILARLKTGQTADDASRALRAVQPALREATLPVGLRPEQRAAYLSEPLAATPAPGGPSALRARFQDPLLAIMVAVGLVLVIACANLANLLLARASARRHELSLRLALGASRFQLLRQLLIESLLLASLGALAGGALALWGGRLLVDQLAASVALPLPLDWRVLGFTAMVTMLTALLFGGGPALRATSVAPGLALTEKSRVVSGASGWRFGRGLAVTQIALSFVLVVGAGLFLRTFVSLAYAPLGFDPAPVLSVSLTMRPGVTLGDEPGTTARYTRVLDAVRAAPGVRAAAFAGGTSPMSGYQHNNILESPPGLSLPESARDVYFRDAGVGWFETFGMTLLDGRGFLPEDSPTFQRVAVVNETLARQFFPGGRAIGQTLREVPLQGTTPVPMTIVGVVADAVYNSVRDGVPPTLYRFVPRTSNLVVRSAMSDTASVGREVSEVIARTDAAFLVTIRPIADQVRSTVERERLVALVSGFFGSIALLLAGVGVFGVMAYNVGQRRREIAVRRALGADRDNITRLVIRRSLTLVAMGLAIGALVSFWLMGFLQPLLYGLGPRDPVTIGGAALVLGLIGLISGWLPARHATRADPASVLREG